MVLLQQIMEILDEAIWTIPENEQENVPIQPGRIPSFCFSISRFI